jgi:hypothetical protein
MSSSSPGGISSWCFLSTTGTTTKPGPTGGYGSSCRSRLPSSKKSERSVATTSWAGVVHEYDRAA